MKFSELPGYLQHELKHGRFENMVSAMEPFANFACEDGNNEIYSLLSQISNTCNNTPEDINKVEEEISALSVTIKNFNLCNISPEYFYKRIDTFTSRSNSSNLAIMMKESIIREMFLKILKVRYNMVRNYMKEFYVKDIKGNGFTVLADYDNHLRLIENNISAGQIIYVDFRKVDNDLLRKNLKLPMSLKDLDDSLKGF